MLVAVHGEQKTDEHTEIGLGGQLASVAGLGSVAGHGHEHGER